MRNGNSVGLRGCRRVLGLCIAVAVASTAAVANTIFFPDQAVEAAIRDAIWKPSGDINANDLTGLTALSANGLGISNLEGIQHCTDLAEVSLQDNRIVDISPLSELRNLAELRLDRNEIVSIVALVDNMGLGIGGSVSVSMNYLDLTLGSSNDQAVEALQARGVHVEFDPQNPIVVLFPDPELEVVLRNAIDKATGDILNTDLIGLTELDVEDWGVLSIEGIQHCVNLEWLDLRDNEIGDIGALAGLLSLSSLNLSNNEIIDIDALANLLNLTELSLYNNRIIDISVLAELPRLEQLDISGNQIGDMTPLLANGGIGSGDSVDVRWNQLVLQPGSQDMLDIEVLQTRGVTVIYDPQS